MGAGILSILIGIFGIILKRDYKHISNAKVTKGIVCKEEYKYDTDEDIPTYYGNVQYFVEGKEYYVKTRDRSSEYRVGKKFKIKYNSVNPEEAIVIHKPIQYGAPIAFIIFGIYAIVSTILQ